MQKQAKPRTARNCETCELKPFNVFCNLHGEALAEFESLGTLSELNEGVTLFREGAHCSSVLVVCAGQVKLSCTSKEGKTLILRIASPGDLLGLGSAMLGSPYLLTAETLQRTSIKTVRRQEFMEFLEKHGEASLSAARALSHEYKSAFFDARRLALSGSAAARLATVLLDWGKASCAEQSEMRFIMSLTHEELANMVGTSRETITRTLGRLAKDKLIRVNGASITILSPDGLEAIAV